MMISLESAEALKEKFWPGKPDSDHWGGARRRRLNAT